MKLNNYQNDNKYLDFNKTNELKLKNINIIFQIKVFKNKNIKECLGKYKDSISEAINKYKKNFSFF